MRGSGNLILAVVVALIFAGIGIFYLIPGVFHPLSADTYSHTTAHLKHALVFFVAAVVSLVVGRLASVAPRE